MKYFSFIFFQICLVAFCNAQMHDNIWIFGYDSGPDTTYGGTLMDFSTIPPQLYYQYRNMNFRQTNSTMSDKIGNLLFYTNGVHIFNHADAFIENGDWINPSPYTIDHEYTGLRLAQGTIVLPNYQNDNRYYLIHTPLEYPGSNLPWHSPFLYVSTIDMDSNGGFGEVIEINQQLIADTLDVGKITAVRHGNGRDWWILAREFYSNKYYKARLTPFGVDLIESQTIGQATIAPSVGQCTFSNDGTKYVQYNTYSQQVGQFLDIYDFERCSGLLSNHLQIHLTGNNGAAGVAISPNSRFLYVSAFNKIFQFDLWAADIEGSKQTVAVFDGFVDIGGTHFYLAQLAPDGKIYINTATTNSRFLHVIHQPDQQGLACQVEQHAIHLPTYNAFTMPNNPNYRLGPIDGSPCDVLGVDNHPVAKFRYGQDTTNYLQIAFTDLSYYEPVIWGWDFGDGTYLEAQNPVHTYQQDGVYEACLTVANEYGLNTFCRTLVIGTNATSEKQPKPAVNIFPNPAQDFTNLVLYDYLPRHAVLKLHDALGNVCIEQRILAGWNSVALEGLLPGIYFYQISDGERRLGAGKVVKVE